MKTLIAVVVAASFMLVGGCSDPHKNEHCVAHQREVLYYQHVKVTSWYSTTTPVYGTVCTQWVHN